MVVEVIHMCTHTHCLASCGFFKAWTKMCSSLNRIRHKDSIRYCCDYCCYCVWFHLYIVSTKEVQGNWSYYRLRKRPCIFCYLQWEVEFTSWTIFHEIVLYPLTRDKLSMSYLKKIEAAVSVFKFRVCMCTGTIHNLRTLYWQLNYLIHCAICMFVLEGVF